MKITIKTVSLIALCCFILNIFSAAVPVNAQQSAAVQADTYSNAVGGYSEYISAHISAEKPQSDIIKDVNSLCVDSPIDITVSVPTEGIYNFGMEYTVAEKRTAALEIGLSWNGRMLMTRNL